MTILNLVFVVNNFSEELVWSINMTSFIFSRRELLERKAVDVRGLAHNILLVLKHQKQKQEEERESMTDKEIDAKMRESMSKHGPRIEVDLLGINLRWTSDEARVVSLEVGRNWDLYDLVCFVWAHFVQHSRRMDDDTYDNELAEVHRLLKVVHHKMRKNDTRSIRVVPTFLDNETRIHFMTDEDISAIQMSPFTVLERPRGPRYVSECEKEVDLSTCSSSSEGVTTDESF